MAHEYTVTTPHGDVNLTTEQHHSQFRSLEHFLQAHHDVIANALQVASVAMTAAGLYLSHGKRGAKLK